MNLKNYLEPSSIAVIGASRKKGKMGYEILRVIIAGGYKGGIYPVNPKARSILGKKCYQSILKVPRQIDMAVIVRPAVVVPTLLKECGQAKVRTVVIFSGGFKEAGKKGEKLQREIKEISTKYNFRILGPNCEGLVDIPGKLYLTFSLMFEWSRKPGPVSIITQSGSIGGVLFRRIQNQGIGFSKIISLGNEADLKAIDLVEYLAQDEKTKVIACYLEEIREGRRFFESMKEFTRKKPVVILKIGRTQAGKKAALSHTGALAGETRIVGGMFKQLGIVEALTLDELVDMVQALVSQPVLEGNRLGILTTAGGLGVQMVDLSIENGFRLPSLSGITKKKLANIISSFASAENPVDLTGEIYKNPTWPAQCLQILSEDKKVDALVLILSAVKNMVISQNLVKTIKGIKKPVLISWTAGKLAGPAYKYLLRNGLPIFSSPGRVMNGLRGLKQYYGHLERW